MPRPVSSIVQDHYALFKGTDEKNTAASGAVAIPKISYVDNEPEFRWALLQDSMAWDKLHEGIKKFAEDGETLQNVLKEKLSV